MSTTQWPIPAGLSKSGTAAAQTILDFLTERQLTYHGGGGKFYTPQEWADRGEDYCRTALLIVTHDGGDHAHAFNYAYENDTLSAALSEALLAAGFRVEQATSWYSGIYRADD